MTIEAWKAVAEILSCGVAVVTAIGALITYRGNSRRERAKWAVQLYEKFYEAADYKRIRDELDCTANSAKVTDIVNRESPAFTDYLNFFELVAFLASDKQLSESDVLGLFQYYLHCLKRHNAVIKYVNDKDKGFEQLRGFLNKASV